MGNKTEELIKEAYDEVTEDKSVHFKTQKAIEDKMLEVLETQESEVRLSKIEEYVHEQVRQHDAKLLKNAYEKVTEDKSVHFDTKKAIEDQMIDVIHQQEADVRLSKIEEYVQEQVKQHNERRKK
jgi:hypothetical protein